MSHWSGAYIGLPYLELGRSAEGVDCWGLVRLVYRQELAIDLPSYVGAYTSVEEHAELAAHIANVTGEASWTRVEKTEAYDVAVFRRGHHETHVGVVVSPGLMLHTANEQSKLERYTVGKWAHRLTGFYRHTAMASRAGQ